MGDDDLSLRGRSVVISYAGNDNFVGAIVPHLSPVSYAHEHGFIGLKSSRSIESSNFGRGSIASRDSIDFGVYFD
jgi:hypothetical protein